MTRKGTVKVTGVEVRSNIVRTTMKRRRVTGVIHRDYLLMGLTSERTL